MEAWKVRGQRNSLLETNVEALAVVPVHQKSKRSEIVQCRIRRPFFVAEVEALVQAVEKFGTGRWRDVKLRAFDNAKHQTYVDLKDIGLLFKAEIAELLLLLLI